MPASLSFVIVFSLQHGRLSHGQINIAQNKENSEDPHQGIDLAKFSGRKLHDRVGNQSEAKAGSDAESEWCGENGDESRDSFSEVPPLDLRDGFRQQHADENQS